MSEVDLYEDLRAVFEYLDMKFIRKVAAANSIDISLTRDRLVHELVSLFQVEGTVGANLAAMRKELEATDPVQYEDFVNSLSSELVALLRQAAQADGQVFDPETVQKYKFTQGASVEWKAVEDLVHAFDGDLATFKMDDKFLKLGKQLNIQFATFDLMRVLKLGYVQITFKLQLQSHIDEATTLRCAVLGDAVELGCWKRPVWMQQVGEIFTTTVILPPTEKKIKWKYFRERTTGKGRWEGGHDRELILTDGKKIYLVEDWWKE